MPQTPSVLYEHPLNERTRTLLRLEHLFRQMEFHQAHDESWDNRATVDGLLGIAAIFARHDLKSELLKELDRHRGVLEQMASTPGVDAGRLSQVLADLKGMSGALYTMDGQLDRQIRKNELLKAVMHRASIPGGACAFDLPQFHYWLQLSAEQRRYDLESWQERLRPVRAAITLLLALIRGSGTAQGCWAREGLYQRTLDPQQPPPLMLRVELPVESGLFPEISGIRNRFSVRFLCFSRDERALQTGENVEFDLTLCSF